jgi:hypothetical protein
MVWYGVVSGRCFYYSSQMGTVALCWGGFTASSGGSRWKNIGEVLAKVQMHAGLATPKVGRPCYVTPSPRRSALDSKIRPPGVQK